MNRFLKYFLIYFFGFGIGKVLLDYLLRDPAQSNPFRPVSTYLIPSLVFAVIMAYSAYRKSRKSKEQIEAEDKAVVDSLKKQVEPFKTNN